MIPYTLICVEVPLDLWATFPVERAFEELNADIQGSSRRMRKGVGERLEKVRYAQLCSYVESCTLKLLIARRRGETVHGVSSELLSRIDFIAFRDVPGEQAASAIVKLFDFVHIDNKKIGKANYSTAFAPNSAVGECLSQFRTIMARDFMKDASFMHVGKLRTGKSVGEVITLFFQSATQRSSAVVILLTSRSK